MEALFTSNKVPRSCSNSVYSPAIHHTALFVPMRAYLPSMTLSTLLSLSYSHTLPYRTDLQPIPTNRIHSPFTSTSLTMSTHSSSTSAHRASTSGAPARSRGNTVADCSKGTSLVRLLPLLTYSIDQLIPAVHRQAQCPAGRLQRLQARRQVCTRLRHRGLPYQCHRRRHQRATVPHPCYPRQIQRFYLLTQAQSRFLDQEQGFFPEGRPQ